MRINTSGLRLVLGERAVRVAEQLTAALEVDPAIILHHGEITPTVLSEIYENLLQVPVPQGMVKPQRQASTRSCLVRH